VKTNFAELTCPKCGTGRAGHQIAWHTGRLSCKKDPTRMSPNHSLRASTKGEHLHILCMCGYDWTEQTLDIKEDSK